MIDLRIKEMFFDRQVVVSAVDKARLKVLSKFGAFVRQTARQSLVKRKRQISLPGRPPYSHTGILKRFIFFGFDSSTKSVVIGPAPMGNTPEALPALEHGGMTTVKPHGRFKTSRRVAIDARPFMVPAFEREQAKLPELWIDSVTP